jgi:16S rRNA (guanine966-N2)-methyltransferase
VARKSKNNPAKNDRAAADARETDIRIIGGEFRGRRLQYHGDRQVRPMKHRTRESIFNLVSTECAGHHAIDLFAGTGALGLEAISRGAVGATFIEKHVPSAQIVETNIKSLGVEDRATLLVTSAFLWAKRDLPRAALSNTPWVVFCSPPYVFFQERQAEMLDLIGRLREDGPSGSILIVEADEHFDFNLLTGDSSSNEYQAWDVRSYPPAVVGVRRAQ